MTVATPQARQPLSRSAHDSTARPDIADLRQSSLFRDVDVDILDQIVGLSTIVSLQDDETVGHQGAPADAIFLILSGQVALFNTASNGTSAVVEVLHPGAHMFLPTVLAGLPLLMSGRTVCASRLIRIPADDLMRLVRTEPSLSSSIMRAQAMEFRSMVRQVCDLKLRTTAQRLGCYLLALSKGQTENSVALRLPFDKRLLAARLGCRQENLSRAFAALRSLGVETHGARVILHDIERLRDYSVPDEMTDEMTDIEFA